MVKVKEHVGVFLQLLREELWQLFLAVGVLLVEYLGFHADKFPFQLTASDYVWGGTRFFKLSLIVATLDAITAERQIMAS